MRAKCRIHPPTSRLDYVLQWVPHILSSKPQRYRAHGICIYLIVLPLSGEMVSAQAELTGGN